MFVAVESLEAAEHLLVRIDDGKFENDNVIDRYSNGGEIKLEIKQLRKLSDKGVCILDGVDLRIPRGKIVGIIGPSGSGKSTVLKALNRLWEPPTGSVYLDGRDVCDIDVLSVRRRVGMLFQLPALFQGKLSEYLFRRIYCQCQYIIEEYEVHIFKVCILFLIHRSG